MPRCLLVFEPPDGGVAQHVLELARGLPSHGWEVEVAGPRESVVYGPLEAEGVSCQRLTIGRALAPGPYARAFAALRRAAASGRYGVIHVHSSKAGAITRPAARLGRTPVVYTPHCFPFIGPQSTRRKVLASAVERGLAAFTDAIICVSEDERREALGQRIAAPERLTVVHNGSAACDLGAPADPAVRAHLSGGPSAATIAVLRPQKAVEVFVRAAPAILDAIPEARLAVVGQGEQRDELERLATDLGVAERLRFFDFTPPAARQLNGLDVFVLPSLWEAFPISILEALACGVPQVAADVGGTREALVHGQTGLLFSPGDANALAGAVIELMRDPERRRAMAKASLRRHREYFGLSKMTGQTVAVYERAISRRR